MECVIEFADQKGKDYVIPIEDLQSVFDAAAEATTPEGILRRMEEQEKKRELEREENLRRLREEYDQRRKAKEAEEEAWWQDNLSKFMDFLDF
jgi:C4-type Zn-finger protein